MKNESLKVMEGGKAGANVTEETLRLIEEKNDAQDKNRRKSEFISSMSHELRSPLNSIIGFTERIPAKTKNINDKLANLKLALEGSMPIDKSRHLCSMLDSIREKELHSINEFCGYIGKSGSHLLTIINDILDLSKIEAARLELSIEKFDVEKCVKYIMGTFRNISEEKNVSLVADIRGNLPRVSADRKRFTQILINLLSNAIKFSSPGDEVTISAGLADSGNDVELCVIDRGTGIPDKFKKNIFNRYEQADNSGMIPGAGLGLAITKKLVELMLGRIWFQSEEGNGSRFYFTIPTDMACNVENRICTDS